MRKYVLIEKMWDLNYKKRVITRGDYNENTVIEVHDSCLRGIRVWDTLDHGVKFKLFYFNPSLKMIRLRKVVALCRFLRIQALCRFLLDRFKKNKTLSSVIGKLPLIQKHMNGIFILLKKSLLKCHCPLNPYKSEWNKNRVDQERRASQLFFTN